MSFDSIAAVDMLGDEDKGLKDVYMSRIAFLSDFRSATGGRDVNNRVCGK